MVFRSLIRNNDASGFGVFAVLIPFIIVIILSGVSFAIGHSSSVDVAGFVITPYGYDDMSSQQRASYLAGIHGGSPEKVYKGSIPTENWWEFWGIWETVYLFPDGWYLGEGDYDDFLAGDGETVDYVALTLSVLTINPPMLEELGIYGSLFRAILILSIALGITELIWFGG